MPDRETWAAPAPLTASHEVAGFECGESALDHWLKHRALRNERQGASRTYVVCVEHRVIAYYCLATASIESRLASPKLRRNMPDPIPMLVLGRLAVDRAWQRHGLGSLLLRDAILRTVQVSDVVGVKGLLVHALTDAAARFYESHGFHPSPTEERTLFLSLGEVLR